VSALYLYAIVDKPPRAPLANARVARVAGAYVVYDQAGAREANADNLKKHDRVVKRLARSCAAVLPFRFGSVVADRASLRDLLEAIAPAIARELENVRDATQFTLRVYGRAARPARTTASGPGTRFMEARLRAHRVPEIDAVTKATKPFVRAARVQRHDRAPLLASVYHLVPRADVRKYRAALASSAKTLEHVRVDSSGPWPPYAFAELQ
jgi:hypothetical protein